MTPVYLQKRMKHIAAMIAEIIDALRDENNEFAAVALDQVATDLDFVRKAYFTKEHN